MAILSRIPLRGGEKVLIAPPLFHSWGFAHFRLGLLLATTMVLARKFDPENVLADDRARPRATRSGGAGDAAADPRAARRRGRKYDTSSLRVVAASGSALPGDLASDWMDEFGDTLYNLYGSTEVAWVAIATPGGPARRAGHRRAPPRGTVLKLCDDDGRRCRRARPGASSWATRCCSRATPAAARRT